MPWRCMQLAALALAQIVALLFPAAPSIQAQDEMMDPADAVQAFFDARSAGDAASAAALFTDNAIYIKSTATGACSQQSPCIGRAAILAVLQADAAGHQCVTTINRTVSGSVVISYSQDRNDRLRARGVERIVLVSMTEVSGGKIVANYVVGDLTDPQTAANFAAPGQQVGPPIPNPPTPCG